MFEAVNEWFIGLGAEYGVNPYLFGGIYVGAIPLFTASVAWLVRNARKGRSVAIPALAAGFFFVSAYLYLIVAGENVPVWVYAAVAVLVVGGAWSTIRSVRAKVADARAGSPHLGAAKDGATTEAEEASGAARPS